MFRNQYDTDVTTWSPAGRLHQVEYAMEAVKQGSAAVGVQSKQHAVLATLKRAPSELSSFQRKIFRIDSHLGIAIAGLTADGRVLSKYMRSECINHKFVYDSPMPVARLILQVADKCQICTQSASRRPYGVGLLAAGVDQTGPHLFQTCPSGNYYECHAMAIGSRSQAAKTYLERKFETFQACTREELINHALRALKESCADGELTSSNSSFAIVGVDEPFTIVEGDDIKPYLAALEADESGSKPAEDGEAQPAATEETAAAAEGGGDASMPAALAAVTEAPDVPAPGAAATGEDDATPMES